MFSILIDGVDYSDRLLEEEGLTNFNREAEDETDFKPVSATINVALSDIDGEILRALGCPTLTNPIGGDLNRMPIEAGSLIHVQIYDDGEPYFAGYIEPNTIRPSLVNESSPDSERIVGFTVFDYAKKIFDSWNLGLMAGSHYSWWTEFAEEYNGDTVHLATLPWVLQRISNYTQQYYGGLPISGVYVSPDLAPYHMDAEIAANVIYRQTQSLSLQTPTSFVEDLAKRFLAVVTIDSDRVLNFISREAYNTRFPSVDINEFEIVNSEPVNPYRAEYVRDLDPTQYTIPNLPQTFAQTHTAWFYIFLVAGLFPIVISKRGDTQTPAGQIFDAVPYAAGWLTLAEYAVMFYRRVGTPPNQTYYILPTDQARQGIIRSMLLRHRRMIVKTSGRRFFPYQPVTLAGVPGYKVIKADIEPQADESTLTLEYAG